MIAKTEIAIMRLCIAKTPEASLRVSRITVFGIEARSVIEPQKALVECYTPLCCGSNRLMRHCYITR